MPRSQPVRFPGIATVTDGATAVGACEQEASDATAEVSSRPTTPLGVRWCREAAVGQSNAAGRPLIRVDVESESTKAAALTGLAMAGLRTTGFMPESGLAACHEALAALAGRHLTTVLHVVSRSAVGDALGSLTGHAACHAQADSGWFQYFARDVQAAVDLSLIAHRLSESALTPGMVVQDGAAVSGGIESVLLPEREMIAAYLGDPQDLIESPTAAQRLLFGEMRRRIPELWSVDSPAATGAPLGADALTQAGAAQGLYFARHLPALADAATEEFQRLTGRRYGRVGTYLVADAEYLIVAQGSIVPTAEAVADYLRHTRRVKVGVVDVTMFRPFPGDLLGPLLKNRRGVAVLEQADAPLAEDPPLLRELRAVIGKCHENGRGGRVAEGALPYPGYGVYTRPEHAPPLFGAVYGSGSSAPAPEGLIGVVENMLPEGSQRRRVFASVDFSRDPARSPKQELYLQSLADGYPGVGALRAQGSTNPELLPKGAIALRLHGVAGRELWSREDNPGATLAALAGLHVKGFAQPGTAVRGRPTVFQLVAAAQPVKANCAPRTVDVVLVADPAAFSQGVSAQSDPLEGLKEGGVLVLQSRAESAAAVWATLPERSRELIRERQIEVYAVDALGFGAAEAGPLADQLRVAGWVMQGAALATPVIAAATRLVGKPLMRALREMLRQMDDNRRDGTPAGEHGDSDPAVMEGQIRALRQGLEGLLPIPHEAARESSPELGSEDGRAAQPTAVALPEVLKALSVNAQPVNALPVLDLHRFWEQVGIPYAQGAGAENLAEPFIASGIIPAASGLLREMAPAGEAYPRWIPERCTGCGDCWMLCPDSALPGLVSTPAEVLATAVRRVEARGHAVRHLPRAVRTLESNLRQRLAAVGAAATSSAATNGAATNSAQPVSVAAQLRASAADVLASSKLAGDDKAALEAELAQLMEVLGDFPLAVTEPYFAAMERAARGDGGLLSVTLDPGKCKGCMACVSACPEQALSPEAWSGEALGKLKANHVLWQYLPNTDPKYLHQQAGADGVPGWESLLLDKRSYLAMSGGDDGAPGAGERTVLHLFAATVEGLMRPRVAALLLRLNDLQERLERHIRLNLAVDVEDPEALRKAMGLLSGHEFTLSELSEQMDAERDPVDVAWLQRVTGLLAGLKAAKRLYTGGTADGAAGAATGRAALGLVQSTEDAARWGFRYPYTPFPFPWAGYGGHGGAALALGLFEGQMARLAESFKLLRMAELELEGQYNPDVHDPYFQQFGWREFDEDEVRLCPPIVVAGESGSLHGSGLAVVSALLGSGRPLKVLCLDTEAYRHLLAPEGPDGSVGGSPPGGGGLGGMMGEKMDGGAYLAQGSLADLPHLMESFVRGLDSGRPALLNVYLARLPENGTGDDHGVRQSRLALESRAHPAFRFDPDGSDVLHECLSLEGNPTLDDPWPLHTLNFLDEEGTAQSLERPLTCADYALAVPGLEQHFHRVAPEDQGDQMLPVAEYLALDAEERAEAVAYVHGLDARGRLARLALSPALLRACLERKQAWEHLRSLCRLDIVPVDEQAIADQARAAVVSTVTRSLIELAKLDPAQGGAGLPTVLSGMAEAVASPDVAVEAVSQDGRNGGSGSHA